MKESRTKRSVKVEVLNDVKDDELEEMIQSHFDKGFTVQDSQVEWYQGKILGVYVFIKESRRKTDGDEPNDSRTFEQ